MKALTSRTSLAALGALALGAVLATAQPAAAAVVSETGPLRFLELGSEATIDAKGAVAFAAVTVTCDPGSYGSVQVNLTQSAANRLAKGTATKEVTCDGTPQQVQLTVVASDRPFRTGEAWGSASALVCGDTGCVSLFEEHIVTIVK
ncbi:hypothetical protein V6U81_15290 [Micromonospora sp. CPCC 205711]|uniref:hypothetical protein n=1 Tax=Micromonospora sp. CPCC 205547 TaxID=3122400 RepID=UPI002FEE8982